MICPDCKKEFDPAEEAVEFKNLIADIIDWTHPYSGIYCAKCDYEESCSAEGGLEDYWD